MQLMLFDIDGTLVKTHGAGREATRHAMIEVFGTCGALAGHYFGGKTDWQTLHELLHEAGMTHEEIERKMPEYNAAMGRQLDAIIGQYPVEALPGTLELVQALRQRDDVALGIVTGNVSSTAPIKLRAAGFDPAWFPVGAFGHEAMARDNLPALALARAVEHYGYPFTPEEVMVIGDTPADVSCARALGAVVVAVETGFCEPGELAAAKPDFLLRDLTEFSLVFA
jgi:phosphoglycolate phosphatase-like HAD superfamily hydrolase